MPILKSAFKRMRADKKRKLRNLNVTSELKSLARKVDELITAGKSEQLKEVAAEFSSKLDRASRHGIIHKNAAARRKSRLWLKLAKVKA